MKTFVLAVLCGAAVACGGSDHNPPGGGDDGGDDGDGTDVDASVAPDPDAAPGDVSAAQACSQFADEYCTSTVQCDRFPWPPGQDTLPGCVAAQEPYCLERRAAPVASTALAACVDSLRSQACSANMIIPGPCRLLWDTIVPDAGPEDAGADPQTDAGLPDAG